MRRIFKSLCLVCLLTAAGCSSSSDSSTAVVGSSVAASSPVGQLELRFLLAKSVPAGITQIRLSAFDAQGRPTLAPLVRPKAGTILLDQVPTSSVDLLIEVLQGEAVRGLGHIPIVVRAGQTSVVVDPAYQMTSPLLTQVRLSPSQSLSSVGSRRRIRALGTFEDQSQRDVTQELDWGSGSSEKGVLAVTQEGPQRVEAQLTGTSIRASASVVGGFFLFSGQSDFVSASIEPLVIGRDNQLQRLASVSGLEPNLGFSCVSPDGRFFYLNASDQPLGGRLRVFQIDPLSGGLQALSSFESGIDDLRQLAVSPDGGRLFCAGFGGQVLGYQLDPSDGHVMGQLPGFPISLPRGVGSPWSLNVAADGSGLSVGTTEGGIFSYDLGTTGSPSLAPGFPVGANLDGVGFVESLVSTIDGRFLVLGGRAGGSQIAVFSPQQKVFRTFSSAIGSGSLSSRSLATHPNGQYFFVGSSSGSPKIAVLKIDSDGNLTPVPGSPFSLPALTGDVPVLSIKVDGSGHLVASLRDGQHTRLVLLDCEASSGRLGNPRTSDFNPFPLNFESTP